MKRATLKTRLLGMIVNKISSRCIKSINLIFSSSIFVFLCGNVLFISVDYFKYATDTNVSPVYPVKLTVPSISLCFTIKSLLEGTSNQFNSTLEAYPFLGMRVKDVFDQAPRINETLKSCKYRDFDLDILINVADGDECTRRFNVARYIMQGFVCYRYSPRPPLEYSFHALVNSIYDPRELYHLTFRAPLSEKQVMYPVIHLSDLPREDRVYNQEEFIDIHSMHHVSYSKYESVSLPAPYDTQCSPVPPMACYQSCIDDHYRKYNFISDSSLVPEGSPSENLFIPPEDAHLGDLDKVRSLCFNRCDRQACFFRLMETKTAASYPDGEEMVLVIETIDTLTMKVIHNIQMKFFDYVTQVATVISIWLGISVISLTALLHSDKYHSMTAAYRKIEFYTHLVTKMHQLAKKKKLHSPVQLMTLRMSIENNTPHYNKSKLSKALPVMHFIIFQCFSKLLVLSLFSWQLFNVMRTYFLYRTTIKFDYDVNPSLILPSMSLCYANEDIFNISVAGEVNEQNYDKYFKMKDTAFNNTLEQVFSKLDLSDGLDGCALRNWTDRFHRLIFYNQSECLERFNVIKFFAHKELCFGFIPQERYLPYHVSDVRVSMNKPGLIYAITGGSKLQFAREIQVYLYFGEALPNAASKYVTFYREDRRRIIRVSNRLYNINLLTPPYDTRCSKIGRTTCFEACVKRHLSPINRVSYNVRVKKPVPKKVISYTDLLNPHVYKVSRNAEEVCESSCSTEGCHYNFTTTFAEGDIYLNSSRSQVVFAAQTVSFPNSKVVAIPVQVIYDLLYQILCCLSFWLGFSFFAINPASLIARKKAQEASEYLNERLNNLKKILGCLHERRKMSLRPGLSPEWLRYKKKVTLIYILSFLGCIIHTWYSFKVYFKYSALIDVHQKIDLDTHLFPLICLDAAELIVRTHDPSHLANLSDPLFKAKVLDRSISSLLADTPRGEDMIQSCQYWGTFARQGQVTQMEQLTDRILFETRNRSLCYQVYRVNRFLVQNYMCYAVRPKNYTNWTLRKMGNTLNNGKTLVEITVKSTFLTNKFSLLVDRLQYFPYTSSTWAPNVKHVAEYNRYHISYIRYVQSLLPSPYPLGGFVPLLFDRCNNFCINSKFAAYNLTLSKRFTDASSLKYITLAHRLDSMAPTFIKTIVETCERKCIEYNDHVKIEKDNDLHIFVPTVRPLRVSKNEHDEVAFLVRGTNNPVIIVYFTLRISFFEQLINFGSVVAIWFGCSMMHLAQYASGKSDGHDFSQDSHIIEQRVSQLEKIYTRGVS